MKHLRVFLSVLVAAVLLLVGVSAPTQASSTDKPSSDRQHILNFFRQYDVPQQRWEPLLKELKAGQTWDSLEGGAPTAVEVKETSTTAVQVSRFPDGSVRVTSIERPTQVVNSKPPAEMGEGAVTPMAAIEGCTLYTGSGYAVFRGCAVTNQWGNIFLGFNADYTNINGANDTIDCVYNQTAMCWGYLWSCTPANFDPVKTSEDGWGAATARAHSWVSNPLGSFDVWVQLNVGGNSAWATSS